MTPPDPQRSTAASAPIQADLCLAPGSLSLFAVLCEQLAATAKKLSKRALIAAYLASLEVEDAARAALYLSGAPFAETDLRKLQVGGSTLTKAVAQLSGADAPAMHAAYRKHGDLGDAAFDLLQAQQDREAQGRVAVQQGFHPNLTLAELESAFTALALARGPSAKLDLLLSLLVRAAASEARYIVKLVSGDMRTGVKQSLVEEAIAACYQADPPQVRRALMLNGSLAEVVRMAAAGTLAAARMRLFHPLGFMLASPVATVEEALQRFAEELALEAASPLPAHTPAQSAVALRPELDPAYFTPLPLSPILAAHSGAAPPSLRAAQLEDKYDGMRAQLHCGDPTQPGRVGLFSRNREDLAESFPELLEAFAHFEEEAILDGEILAWSPARSSAWTPAWSSDWTAADSPLEPSWPGNEVLVRGASAEPAKSVYAEAKPSGTEAEDPEAQEQHTQAAGQGRTSPVEDAAATHPHSPDQNSTSLQATSTPPQAQPRSSAAARALPFSSLQQRLGRKRVTPQMRQATPVVFMAFDLLYHQGELLLEQPLSVRRKRLEALVAAQAPHTVPHTHASPPHASPPHASIQPMQASLFAAPPSAPGFCRLLLAPAVPLTSAEQLEAAYSDARARGNEGVMLKAAASLYQPGRRGLAWLKLKRELATLDVVITGAEFGHGRRASVLSDYTFAVRAGAGPGNAAPGNHPLPTGPGQAPRSAPDQTLLNVGKAYSGLTDAEIEALSQRLQQLTLEDYGSFRTVDPVIVLEVAFNNITRSDRHASGFALRFPRILRIRPDKPVDEIDTLERVAEIYASQPDL